MLIATATDTARGSYPLLEDTISYKDVSVAATLNEAAKGMKNPTLVNLASQEYFGAVDVKALEIPVVTCHFKEAKGNQLRVLGFFAKKARGLMARYAIDHRIDEAGKLKAFDTAGYKFEPELSTDTDWVFARPQPPPPR